MPHPDIIVSYSDISVPTLSLHGFNIAYGLDRYEKVLTVAEFSTSRIIIPRIYTQTLKKLQENVLCQKSIVYDQENDILKVFCIWVTENGRYDVIKIKR